MSKKDMGLDFKTPSTIVIIISTSWKNVFINLKYSVFTIFESTLKLSFSIT